MRRTHSFLTGVVFALVAAADASAQAWSYPAFQQALRTNREFNLGVADAGKGGTTFLVQWREGLAARSQFTLEAAIAAPDTPGADNIFAAGATYALQVARATTDMPLDILGTAGVGIGLGEVNVFRIPFGVSIGHRFELEKNLALSPFVHPRMSLDLCNCTGKSSEFGLHFDVGANLELTPALSVRAVGFFGGGDLFGRNGIGLSLAWNPPGLER